MRLHETKKLLYTIRNGHQIEEAAHRMEKIFASYISDKGLITRMYRELKKLNSSKISDPMKKWANELSRTFSEEEVKWSKNTKKCSTFQAKKQMQIKTTLRFHLTPFRMTIIKNMHNNECWLGCGIKGILIYY
jgi:phenylalanyl-tRNA synthetase alpha subunit